MTGRRNVGREIGRDLAAYLEARSVSKAPDGLLDSVVTGIEATRQRPAWRVPERWLPTRAAAGVPRMRRVVVLLAVIAAIAILGAALALTVGSRHRLPAPFGLARPGLIAYADSSHIFVVNPDGSDRRQLASGTNVDRPTFSPDGTEIAYQSQNPVDLTWALIAESLETGASVTLVDHMADLGDFVWSPDSQKVAFGASDGPSTYRLYVADIHGGAAHQLGPRDLQGVEPSWSPDGSEIAFKHLAPCCDTLPTLWLIGADGTDARQLSHAGGLGNALWNTVWSPDGKQLAFLADGTGGRFDVFVINADGTGENDISKSPEDEYWPSWSPDGRHVAFPRMSQTMNNQGTLVVVDPDGSHPILFDGWAINSNSPVWSPDAIRVAADLKNPDPAFDYNDAIVVFDLSRAKAPTIISAPQFSGASWQRLAP